MNDHLSRTNEDLGEYGLPQWYALVSPERRADVVDLSVPSQKANRLTLYQGAPWQTLLRFGPKNQNVAFFEGYLFDRDILAATLGLPSTADYTQIVTRAYLRWGADMFDQLDGAYLAAVWDEGKQRFIIGHDGFSKHPVYYAMTREGFWFASNILALASNRTIEPRLNKLSLARRLVLQHPLAGQTFFANIRRLLPGSFLIYHADGSRSEHRYWQPIPEEEPYYSEERVLDEYRDVLQRAVDRRMELGSDGILLSGGVDSTVVAILVANYTRQHNLPPVTAFSATQPFEYSQGAEIRMQKPVARGLGMPLERSSATQWLGDEEMLWRAIVEMPQLPAPEHIPWIGSSLAFERYLRAKGGHKLMTGSGGDDWLSVNDAIAADYIRSLSFNKLLRLAQMRRRRDLVGRTRAAEYVLWRHGVKHHLASYRSLLFPAQRYSNIRRTIQSRFPPWLILDESLREELVTSIYDGYTSPLTGDGRKPSSYYWHWIGYSNQNPYMTYELERNFHISGLTGVRQFSPFHDRQLINFFRRVHPHTLLYSNRNKGLLRHFAAENLPGLGLERQEKNYPSPSISYVHDSLRQQLIPVGRRVGSAHVESIGMVDGQTYMDELSNSIGYPYSNRVYFYIVMSTESWLRNWCG